MNSIVWYDYETFGTHPALDRIAQFAAIRTDENLNEIEAPVELFCRQADDYLPNPYAVLVTGITPQECNRKGVPEHQFIQAINQMFSQSGTCVAGYNSIRFDDEFTRYALYRNFLDPYAREWQNGNSRWDLLDIVRCTYALRPEGINWPTHDNGKPSFRLEHLTAANGLDHGKAHDAVSDVRATIALARLIRDKQPKLFDYFFSLRNKAKVQELIDTTNFKPLVHVSGMIPAEQGCMTVVVPLCWHPTNKNSVIVWDLQIDPAPLFQLDVDSIKWRVFTKAADLPTGRLPLKEVHLNKSPVLAPLSVLTKEQAERWQIDGDVLRQHLAQIRQGENLTAKLAQVFSGQEFAANQDVDTQLYDAFFPNADKAVMAQVHDLSVEQMAQWPAPFQDARGAEMWFRFRARNYPESLNEAEQEQWEHFRAARLKHNDARSAVLNYQNFAATLQQAANEVVDNPTKLQWLEELQLYAESIYPYEDF